MAAFNVVDVASSASFDNQLDRALAALKIDPNKTNAAESPFQNYTSLTGFEAQAWIDSVAASTANIEIPENHGKAKVTIYKMITTSRYTTKLARLIDEYPDIASTLDSTEAEYTVFVPPDAAFENHANFFARTAKDLLENLLKFHIAPARFPASFLLTAPNLPTLLNTSACNGVQRMHNQLDERGMALNYYSNVIVFDIFCTNGVIHVIEELVLPPPPALTIIDLLPGQFSMLQLGLLKTKLAQEIQEMTPDGITLFAPSNHAFQKLGSKANAFLFSPEGESHLHALLKYHIVINTILYSNAFYASSATPPPPPPPSQYKGIDLKVPKGFRAFQLPTLLEGQHISVSITRAGREIQMRLNGTTNIVVPDGLAEDGVVHGLSDVLFPPPPDGGAAWSGEDLEIAQLKDILARFI